MKILFVTHPYPNYVPDLLMHGLRKVLGENLIDYPRKACVYDGILGLGVCPEDQKCPDWFPNNNGAIDRSDIPNKVRAGFFDFVVCDLRALAELHRTLGQWPERCVIVDGEDAAQPITPGPFVLCRRETDGSDPAIPLPMALPEEIFQWITRYDDAPKHYTIGFLGSSLDDDRKAYLDLLSSRYGNTLFQATEIPSEANPLPQGRMSRDDYYRHLQQCRVLLSLPGAGCDTFRFWEHAACNAVHLALRRPIFIPDDFEHPREIIRFDALDDLHRHIDAVLESPGAMTDLIQGGRRKLLRHHTTTRRAVYFLDRITKAFDYSPVAHARDLASKGRPDRSIEVLDSFPVELVSSNPFLVNLALEKQKHYLQWQKKRSGIDPPHALFSRQRREFAQVTALAPHCTESYRLHAEFWNRIGRTDMAQRVWRSIAHLDPEIARDSLAQHPLEVDGGNDPEAPPLWNGDAPPPRILIITHDYSDYGMDTLYHGLCQLLGQHNVVEFPWKPTLHGQNFEAANNYPCVFHYPGRPIPIARLEAELRDGKFDLILFGDVVQLAHGQEVRRLANANPDIPLVLYDTWDDCHIPVERLLQYVGRDRFDLMFKREMLAGVDYGPDTFPLPFGYALEQQQPIPREEKSRQLFWAGKREYGLRPIYLRRLEERLGYALDQQYDQATYQSKLRGSRMGLSFFGCGFDSVRYWELPAHSVMLMAERPPIRIPHNFTDGQTAVFFDDLPELEAKLDHYLHRPDEVDRIAAAGHAHYLAHHTCRSRAGQMLGRIDQALGGHLSKAAQNDARPTPHHLPPPGEADLFVGLVKGENYGWGVCSQYLIEELSALRPVRVLKAENGSAANGKLGGPLFQALANVNFEPLFAGARGTRNYGYTFFENELNRCSVENAKQYDLIMAGSRWCRDKMIEKDITHCDVLIQGIDPKLFYPIKREKSQDRFVIFSGGKFELRKGQDILLRAVKILQDKYADIHLVNCWYNLWPESLRQMTASPYISFDYQKDAPWHLAMEQTYQANGLDPVRIQTMEIVAHHRLRSLFAQTDIGVFPNRCEGGTNLVLMEYMACAKPVIATYASGHKDIVNEDNALLLRRLKDIDILDDNGALIGRWQDPSLEELVARIEYAYHHRDAMRIKARKAAEDLSLLTWRHCAERLTEMIDRRSKA